MNASSECEFGRGVFLFVFRLIGYIAVVYLLATILKTRNLKKTNHLKSAYINSTQENIEGLINYLKNIGGKTLTMICLRQNAFKTKWTEREYMLICRCHIQNAAEYLISIKNDFSNNQIKVIIADIAKYVKALDINEDVSFIIVSTKTLPSAIHFDIAKRLFFTHQIRDQNQNNYHTDILTIYSLRLSLESRIRGLLGIDYATTTSKGKNIGLSTLIKVSKELKSISYSDDFNWTEIEWINDWLNHHMHRNIRPYPWVIFQAIEALKSFVDPKDPLLIDGRIVSSIYSATYVYNEVELEKEIETALKTEYHEIEIKWLSEREIMKH